MKHSQGTSKHQRWLGALLIAALLLAALPALADAPQALVVNPNGHDVTNVRECPDYTATIKTTLPVGTQVAITRIDGDWYGIQAGGCTGYIHKNFLCMLPSAPVQPVAPVMPIAPITPNATIVTNGSGLNLRADASTDSAILISIPNGTRVQVLTHGAIWSRVQAGAWTGYMYSKYLQFDGMPKTEGYAATVKNPKAKQLLNLRPLPDTSSESLGLYPNGTAVTVLGVGTQWHRVNVDGVEGYMMAKYLKIEDKAATAHKTVNNPGSFVNLRENAGYAHKVVARVKNGAAASVVIPYGAWSQVIVREGDGFLTGFMLNSFLK
ncbi:MAG: SH3 domain-containing protein [Oscillospiraceae bacterium]|jgi:uncharacterized protein YgiM (DUF1202 family)|nr:SH3 domain-containing protein [Oscillospiraceae bacterium]